MGEIDERCTACGHLLISHDSPTGCTEHVPGTMERMPGACECGSRHVLADVLPFRTRTERNRPAAESTHDGTERADE